MKLVITKVGMQGVPTAATLSHNEEEISWNIALFDKMSGGGAAGQFDIFEQINGYWAYLSKQKQDEIFAIYKEIRETFDLYLETNDLTSRLYHLVSKLYSHHELADLKHWIDFYSNVLLPEGIILHESFKDTQEASSTRERTYLKEDYKWLVTLSVALRVMIPVWGEFISITRKETGTVFKEYYAYKLLAFSNIAKSDPMERLRVYVEHSVPADKSQAAAILGGISSEDFPIWILSLVLIRRLSVGDVRGVDPNSSLVTFIYKYIGQKVKSHDNSFIGMVKDKIVDGQGQDSENNLSKLEGYKIKQDTPDGDIATIEHHVDNIEAVTLKVCPDIDLQLLYNSLESVKGLDFQQIHSPQFILMQWVLKPAVSPKGLLHLKKSSCLNAVAATQAILWHLGHRELAALSSAVELEAEDMLELDTTESRARILKDQVEVLDKLFPYIRRPFGKQKLAKRVNPAVESIESLASMFIERQWIMTLPQEWSTVITNGRNTKRIMTPHDIKIKLANLVIELTKRRIG